MIQYLSTEQVVTLHQRLTSPLSGDPGIGDLRALDAAVLRPTLTFDGEDLYPTVAAKAAVLLHGLVTAAPFIAASKGTAAISAECFLAANGYAVAASDQDLAQLVTAVELGELSVEAVAIWFSQRMHRR